MGALYCFNQIIVRTCIVLLTIISYAVVATPPVESMFVITLSGHVKCPLGLYGSPNKSLITAPGQTSSSIQLDSDSATNPASDFVGAVNFGTLSGGDGTDSQASFCLRARGNTKCHIGNGFCRRGHSW